MGSVVEQSIVRASHCFWWNLDRIYRGTTWSRLRFGGKGFDLIRQGHTAGSQNYRETPFIIFLMYLDSIREQLPSGSLVCSPSVGSQVKFCNDRDSVPDARKNFLHTKCVGGQNKQTNRKVSVDVRRKL